MRLARLIGPELETLLREDPAEVRGLLDEIHPEDIADIVEEFDDQRATDLLIELPREYAAEVFARLDEDRQAELVERMGLGQSARIAIELDADDRADFFGELPPDIGAPLLQELERIAPEAAEEVEELTRWPETSAGGLMTTEYWSVPLDATVADALQEIRKRPDEAEVIDVVYVVDAAGHLVGLLTLRDLVIKDPQVRVSEVMRRNINTVPPDLDQEEVARVIAKYDLSSLPVVDASGTMLGLITPDDILDVIEEEQDEDVQKMGAVQPLDDAYFRVSFLTFIRKRAPWLLVLFLGESLTATAMKAHEDVLTAVAALTFFVPLLISAGGNSGSQSSTLIIRGLAVGDVHLKDWWRVLLRELAQGFALGAILAAAGVSRVLVGGNGIELALLVGIAVMSIVILACITGAMMPIVLSWIGVDPATSSTPFIASLVDVLGIVIYLTWARWILGDLLARAAGS